MLHSCKKETGLSPVVYRKLENVFKELQTLFPATPSCAIVNAQGELLYAFGEEASAGIQEDICLTLQKLKRAAVKFAETQGEHECSLLRVKGTKQIFSCYQIGENFMAFFTPLPVDEEVESVQTELRMQALCEELKLMLLDANIAKPN